MREPQQIERFKKWLRNNGAEILPTTNEYEAVRFKGKSIGVLYTTGKVANKYTTEAINSFKTGKKWKGKPVNVGRKNSYKKQKAQLLERDGTKCFFCGNELEEDITVEHLIALVSGGKNSLSNMVLAHTICNNNVSNLPIYQKIEIALINRIRKELQENETLHSTTK